MAVVKKLLAQYKLSYKNIAFLGDDVQDIECMRRAGFCACPANAVNSVKSIASYIGKKKGAQGFVREVIDLILSVKGIQ